MNQRLFELRKALSLSQEAFAAKINIKPSTIGGYEKGRRVITDRVVSDICREFNVNEDWLRNGEGPMFRPPKGIDNEFAALAAELIKEDTEEAEWIKDKFIRYKKLPKEVQLAFVTTIKKLFAEIDSEEGEK